MCEVHIWFGDNFERELDVDDMFLAVYAAGGGKRNMANFTRQQGGDGTSFRTADVFLNLLGPDGGPAPGRLHICRYASSRQEWVAKPLEAWQGHPQVKLIPEWFKARFWDNKQEKKHPWFMFALLGDSVGGGAPRIFTSLAFPVHQYYPTGSKKTDPNDVACRLALHSVLKQAPPTTLRLDLLSHGGGSSGGGHKERAVARASATAPEEEDDEADELPPEEPSTPRTPASPFAPISAPTAHATGQRLLARRRHSEVSLASEVSLYSRASSISPPSDATDLSSEDSVAMQCEPDEGVPPSSPDAYRTQFKNFHVQNAPLYQDLGETGMDAVALLLSFRCGQTSPVR